MTSTSSMDPTASRVELGFNGKSFVYPRARARETGKDKGMNRQGGQEMGLKENEIKNGDFDIK